MRIRRRVHAPFSFGIQALLALVAGSAFMMWCGAFGALIAIACIVAHYALLASVSIFVAHLSDTPKSPAYCNWQFENPDDGNALRLTVTTFLVFHYVCKFFWLMVMLPTGFPTIWHTLSFGPLTLAQVDHLCLAAFSLLLVTSFLSRAYADARFSRRVCFETSTLLTFLAASQFTVPP
ncbi:hypothetical protein [Roseiconus lacunae]|uniref:Uncharacterized protein n=1 Tax=Roseiconus lacunae TaxID=2605694 RepID=A0ABT7PHB8_9BACT|nr:hypothetical protein [Roseiconus lacunae]MDM4015899.1 hypothetical protein [Roseiconus lacunae]